MPSRLGRPDRVFGGGSSRLSIEIAIEIEVAFVFDVVLAVHYLTKTGLSGRDFEEQRFELGFDSGCSMRDGYRYWLLMTIVGGDYYWCYYHYWTPCSWY